MNWAEFPWGKQLYLLHGVVCRLNEEVCPHFTQLRKQAQLD